VRYNGQPTRPIIMAANGMITSGHALASQAGMRVLQNGGNAIDAAVTAGAVLGIVQPDMSGAGGDAFMLYHEAATGRMWSMNASGRAPAEMTIEILAANRQDRSQADAKAYEPGRGPNAVSVPGAVRAWADALDRFGTISLSDALGPAIAYAEQGFPVSVRLARSTTSNVDILRRCAAAASVFLRDGAPYEPGDVLRQSDLGRTLRSIATDGADAFYSGDIGRRLTAAHRAAGGLLEETDLTGQDSIFGDAISTTYRGYAVHDQPPVSLGAVLLEELNIVEGFDLAALPLLSAERAHLLLEAKKLAFGDMEAYLTDPESTPVPISGLLSPGYAAARRGRIDLAAASDGFGAGNARAYGSHTSYLAVVDGQGNAVSWIQSIFERFGSGWMAEGTGVLLNDRMNGFSIDPGHVNRVEGGKRTANTLNAPMVTKDGLPYLVFGTPGGYGQVQSNLQMLTAHIDHDLDVMSMIETPRWLSQEGRHVTAESRFPTETVTELARLGHEVTSKAAWSSGMGDGQAIRINQATGVLEGGADPRREGYVIGW
jgi:gamma-glutamyltranspeptidase/glutathione hydrolase